MSQAQEMSSDSSQATNYKSNKIPGDHWATVVLIRILYFTYYMADAVLHPFLPEYYVSRGYGSQIVGLLGSITPFATFLAGPAWGVLTDSMQAPFAILFATISLSILIQVLVSFVSSPYLVMLLVGLKSILSAPVRSIIDSLVLQQLKDRSEFGKMRLWGLIGAGLGTIMGGYFLEGMPIEVEGAAGDGAILNFLYRVYNNLVGYRLLFFAHIVLHIPVFVAIRSFQQDQRENTARRAKEKAHSAHQLSTGEVLISLLTNRDAIIFFLLVYSMGIAGGISDNFTYARFREVGASGKSMGSSRLFSSAIGAVMFWYSGPVSTFLGTESVLLFSLLTVTVRFRLYAVMDHVWYAYVGEGLRGFTFGCFWTSATLYCSDLAPEGARSTMLLLLNGAYNGIGRSTGAVLGGQMQALTGGTEAIFRYCSVASFALAAVFAAYKSTVFTVSGPLIIKGKNL
jgi:hypothetical protein